MNTDRKRAGIVGGLFITGTVAGVLSLLLTGSIQGDPALLDLASVLADETRILTGALMVLIMAFALAMIPVMLYPVFRRYSAVLALGAVVFRGVLEAVAYIIMAISWLSLITVSREHAVHGEGSAVFEPLGMLLLATSGSANHILGIVFSLGALMIYYLFHLSGLIPRWLSLWGLAGGALYLIAPLLGIFGYEAGFLMAPLAVQEMVLAIWLIARGFLPGAAPQPGDI